jgi:catechol 2,3-dioxygenase-like lactoylglutathione lyase family enzyme
MITGIDHVVIGVHDLDAGVAAYERLLNRTAAHRYERDGVATALMPTANVAVELIAPKGDTSMALRLRSAMQDRGEGLMSVAFSVANIERAQRRLDRVGLAPDHVSAGEVSDLHWKRFRAGVEASHGVRMFFIEREAPLRVEDEAGVSGLDHIVIQAHDMEQAAALYGARLGLDMRLDRRLGDRRLMFFRCGDHVVEVVRDRAAGQRLWGLSWRVRDAAAEQARLVGLGLNVSEVRDGLKPGTRVFTIRDNTCGVPTLMIEPSRNRD